MGLVIGAILLCGSGTSLAGPVGDWAGRGLRWNITSTSAALFTYVNSVDAKVVAAAATAFSKWQGVAGSYVAFQSGTANQAQITIEVSSLSNSYAAAQAQPSINSSGNITSCTVSMGSAYVAAAANAAAIEPALTHEVGHCLGLAHSVSQGAVMSYRDGGSDPTEDDILSLITLYPNDDNLTYPLGCASLALPTGSGRGGPPLEVLALGLVMTAFWLGSRKTRISKSLRA